MTSVVVTQTTINASVVQESVSVSVTSSPINVTISPVDINSHSAVTIGTANGLSLSGQVLSLGLSSALATGALSSADWSTFNGKLSDAPSDGTTYGRLNGAWSAVVSSVAWGGITGTLSDQTDLQAALNAKQNSLTFPIASNLGGTGVNNAGTLTNASNTTITGGGTVALGGFTLTVPATGTAALLGIANAFTAIQKINVNSTLALLVEQDGVKDNVLIVDTTNGRIGVNRAPSTTIHIQDDTPAFRFTNTGSGAGEFQFKIGSTTGIWSVAEIAAGNPEVFLIYKGNTTSVLTLRSDRAGVNNSNPSVRLHATETTTTTNAVAEVTRIEARVSTAATGGANGFGTGLSWYAETATDGTYQQQGLISTSWVDATNATRKAKMSLSAYDTAARLGIEIEADGSAANINVFGKTFIDLPSDVIGLRVQAHSTQTSNLQTWETSAGTVRAWVLGDGRFAQDLTSTLTSGSYNGFASDITVNPASSSSVQIQGLVFQQILAGSQNFTNNNWSIVALPNAKTTGTVTQIVGFMARNSKENAGTVTETIGYSTRFENFTPGVITSAYHIKLVDFQTQSGTVTTQYGYYIGDLTKATTNYAVFTNKGAVSLLGSDTKASAAGAIWDGIELRAATATITGSTNITTATGFNYHSIARPTLSAASALTVTNSATLYIANSPLGGGAGPATITNAYALWVDDGLSRFDDQVFIDGSADRIQLRVQAHSTQTTKLQTWENSSGTVNAAISNLGEAGFGGYEGDTSAAVIATKTATASAQKGGHFIMISGASNYTGLLGFQANLRLQTTIAHTGTGMTSPACVDARLQVQSAAATGAIPEVQMIRTNANMTLSTITALSHFAINDVVLTGSGAITTQYGLLINSLTSAGTNYAIYTNAGLVRFGDIVNTTESYQVDGTQVVTNRVIDARIDDAINSGDATTDGVIDAIRDALITHGLIAAA